MAYETVPTKSTGDTWSAADHNKYIRDNFTDVVTFKGVLARCTVAQAIDLGADRVVLFDAEDYDTDAFHSLVANTGRLTVPAGLDGYYWIYGSVMWAGIAATDREMKIKLNDTTVKALHSTPSAAAGASETLGICIALVATDYVTLEVATAANTTLDNSTGANFFGMHLVRA